MVNGGGHVHIMSISPFCACCVRYERGVADSCLALFPLLPVTVLLSNDMYPL